MNNNFFSSGKTICHFPITGGSRAAKIVSSPSGVAATHRLDCVFAAVEENGLRIPHTCALARPAFMGSGRSSGEMASEKIN